MGELENLARQRIAKWRKQHKVSQDRLGQLTGVHQTTVGKWEKGELSVDIDTLDKWARFFGRTLFDLVAHDDVSSSGPLDVVAAFNALPTDDLRARMLDLMRSMKIERGGQTTPSRGSKRG